MVTIERKTIEKVKGDGGAAAVSEEDLTLFKEEVKHIASQSGARVNERRQRSDEVRFCLWEGQATDGRKHADQNGGEPVTPFEGSSDARVRVADMLVNERVLVLVAAGMRALQGIKAAGMEIHDEALGGRLTTILKWVLKNKIGRKALRRELKKVANYQEGDSPAVGVLGVWWKQEWALEERTVTMEKLAEILVNELGQDIQVADGMLKLVRDPMREEEAALLVGEVLADNAQYGFEISNSQAREIVRGLREDNTASWPCPYLTKNCPVWTAYRMLEDIFVPDNTPGDLQKARMIFLREMVSRPELEEREHSMGYDPDFIEQLLQHEGQTGFPAYRRAGVTGDGSISVQQVDENPESRRGLYEVITAFYRASNGEGVPGIYVLPFSAQVEVPAKERELLDYAHGKYPFVEFPRETINGRLWDARGVPELVMTDQNALKLLHDSFNDNVTLATMPPFEVPASRGRMRLVFGPLKQIKVNRPGEIKPIMMPQYPVGNDKQQAEIWRRLNEFWGRFSEEVSPMLAQLHQQGMADDFLDNLLEACDQTLALCQQFMTADELQLVSGAKTAVPVARAPEEIQGAYNVQLDFNVGMMDMQFIKELAEVIGTLILPMDTMSTVQRDRLVQWLFQAFNPNLAEEVLQPVEQANGKEVDEEQANFAKIAAGVEPAMMPTGQNFALRLQTLQEILQKNPEAGEKLSATSRQILMARMKQLAAQVEQQRENPAIGRAVGKQVLGS